MTVNEAIEAIADEVMDKNMRCINCPILKECEESDYFICLNRDRLIEKLKDHYKSDESENCNDVHSRGHDEAVI